MLERQRVTLIVLGLLTGTALTPPLCAEETVFLREGLYSGPLGPPRSGRTAVFTDPIFARYVTGELTPPRAGEVSGTDRRGETLHWRRIEADAAGSFAAATLRGGYLYLPYVSDAERVVVVQANGTSVLYVNGTPRAGDVYAKSRILLPLRLRRGINHIWFQPGRGRHQGVRLIPPRRAVFLTDVDTTLPHLLTHEVGDKLGAIRVVNATDATLDNLLLETDAAGQVRRRPVAGTVARMTARKLPFIVHDGTQGPGTQDVVVRLYRGDTRLDEITIPFEAREPTQPFRRTFLSAIDGSVQVYAVREGHAEPGRRPALFLSVHGAGVEALGQAAAYQAKDWGCVVAPTNRRAFGFDWEDWGRLDMLEVLAEAEARYGTDPERTYLTGHSMGGHGTWILGVTYPGRWAAIAPLSGWRSFFSYVDTPTFTDPNPIEAMLNRAANPSRTLDLVRNSLHYGVFIEHGDADDNVPVREARAMRKRLGTFHPDFAYHEEPGAGHWYGVDHPRIFDFLHRHERPDLRDVATLDFRSVCPGISATSRYVTIYQQDRPYVLSRVKAEQTIRSRRQRKNDEDITERALTITTENVRVFKLDLAHCRGLQKLSLAVDGQAIADLPWPARDTVWLARRGETWTVTAPPADPTQKNPTRYGGFKDAFRHHMVFVYGTAGTADENTWAFDKARFDAETFAYRGNGSIEMIPDHAFSRAAYADRSVIVYGNATTNRAWPLLLADSPVQVTRDAVTVGSRRLAGPAWGLYLIRPRPDSDIASVGVVAGTGLPGLRAVTPNRYFRAGTGYPDLLIVSPRLYSEGVGGVAAAGYFDNDWNLAADDIAWGDLP